jgi:L-ribulokinase
MNGALKGMLAGLTLHHGPAHVFRAVLEASACGLRWIVDTLRGGGVPIRRFVATGGLPHHSPLVLQICADMLGERIHVPAAKQGPALGAAILGALAAGTFTDARSAIEAMAQTVRPRVVNPSKRAGLIYDRVYADYRALAEQNS